VAMFTRETSWMIYLNEKENLPIRMKPFMKGISKMENLNEKENILGRMGTLILEI
jgi:hypothetical protein